MEKSISEIIIGYTIEFEISMKILYYFILFFYFQQKQQQKIAILCLCVKAIVYGVYTYKTDTK